MQTKALKMMWGHTCVGQIISAHVEACYLSTITCTSLSSLYLLFV